MMNGGNTQPSDAPPTYSSLFGSQYIFPSVSPSQEEVPISGSPLVVGSPTGIRTVVHRQGQPSQEQVPIAGSPPVVGSPTGVRTVVHWQEQRLVLLAPTQQSPPESFTSHIIFSCFVFWCCFFPLGFIAFILAIIAQCKARTHTSAATRLGSASYAVSAIGLVAGITILTVRIVYAYSN